MWKWHAVEEIEHKGVAYDTWLNATKDWSRWKRWKVKSIMMLLVSRQFWSKRWEGTLDLLAQAGGWQGLERLDDPYVQPRGATIREKLGRAGQRLSHVEKTGDVQCDTTHPL